MMKKDADREQKAYDALKEMLEEAVESGIDSIEMEWDSGGRLEVYFVSGDTGLGGTCIEPELEGTFIYIINKKAKTQYKYKGKFTLELLGESHMVEVKKRDNFGDYAYNLRLRKSDS